MWQVNGKRAVVCGAGFIGVEMAEQLKHRGMDVSLVEALPQIMAPLDEEMAMMLHSEIEKHGVNVFVNDGPCPLSTRTRFFASLAARVVYMLTMNQAAE